MKQATTIAFLLLATSIFAQTWVKKTPFPGNARGSTAHFVIDNKAYIGGGTTGSSTFAQDFYQYDPASDAWTKKADVLGAGRWGSVSFSIGKFGYYGLGATDPFSSSTYFSDFYRYDPATDVWTKLPDLPGAGRFKASVFVIGNFAYICNGKTASGSLKETWKFDPSNNSWTKVKDGMEERFGDSAFSINGKGYIVGIDVQEYDPAANSWKEKIFADGVNLNGGAPTFVADGKGYLCYGAKAHISNYNPVTNKVTNQGDVIGLAGSRPSSVAFFINGTAYFGLGLSSYPDPVVEYKTDLWAAQYSVAANEAQLDENLVSVLPNIGSGVFKIQLNERLPQATRLDVFSMTGEQKFTSDQGSSELNLSFLPAGVYLLRFNFDKASITKKVVIVR